MIRLLIISGLGLLLVGLYHLHVVLPIWGSVAILGAVVGLMACDLSRRRLGVMMALICAVFTLPFVHLVPYLWFDFNAPPPGRLWGLAINPYMIDPDVISLMGMIGATGGLGLAAGVSASLLFRSAAVGRSEPTVIGASEATMPMVLFLVWLGGAVALSWLAAPKNTVFTTAYSQSASVADNIKFNSASQVAYSLIVIAIIDALYERVRRIAVAKTRAIIGAFAIIVVWLQILRGDRESFPLIVVTLLLYFVWGRALPGGIRISARKAWTIIVIGTVAVFGVSYIVGAARSGLVGVSSSAELKKRIEEIGSEGGMSVDTLLTGTWSAVLLTPLSVAGDDVAGLLPLRSGRTYRDFLLSVVPGTIADGLGYVRPIDAEHGPAWDMRYGQGGTHATVVPFLNFRMAGVFVVIAIWAFILHRLEDSLRSSLSVSRLAFVAMISFCAPHWIWYGEKYVINAVILWMVVVALRRVSADTFSVAAPRWGLRARKWVRRV